MNTQAARASGDTTNLNFVELAEQCGYSVRSLRAYLQIGVLHPGVRQGREARFDQTHIDRLTQVGELRARGYTLNSIADLIATEGIEPEEENLAHARALVESWVAEPKAYPTVAALEESFPQITRFPGLVEAAIERGIASLDGSDLIVHQPETLQLGVDLVDNGVPVDLALSEFDRLRDMLEPIVDQAVALFASMNTDTKSTVGLGFPYLLPHHVMTIGSMLTKRIHAQGSAGLDETIIELD